LLAQDLLGIEDLARSDIELILDTAQRMTEIGTRDVKKVPTLRGRTVVNLFFEPSTRTQTSFEIAGKRLAADVVNFSPSSSSLSKRESILDTAKTLDAMDPDCVIVRHKVAGVPKRIADVLDAPVINAGDGAHEHPTQALLDMLTVFQQKDRLDGLTVAIIGDITHSRVARSNIYGFSKMGAEVRVAGPPTMLPQDVETLGVKAYTSLREVLDGADVVMALRIQLERFEGACFPSVREYSATFGLDRAKLRYAKDDAIVMHPGPVNRGVELSHDLTDHRPSVILDQVRNGVALRMALLYLLAGRSASQLGAPARSASADSRPPQDSPEGTQE
jgi:aspartate carbamoyltransferase catalytic subunit